MKESEVRREKALDGNVEAKGGASAMEARIIVRWCLLLGVFGLCGAAARGDGFERGTAPCAVGETLRYNIHMAGLKVGTQTVTMVSSEKMNGREVYRIMGLTETRGISKLFHGYRDLCTVFVDAATLRPVFIERSIEERGRVCSYTYRIDQEKRTMTVRDCLKGETKVVRTGKIVFDQLSLCFVYRCNPALFAGEFSFDLIKKDSVITVYMKEEGLVSVHLPRSPSGDATPALKYAEEGGEGIEIYVGVEGFAVPLKVVFRTALEEKRKNSVVELYLRDCDSYPAMGVPVWYRELVKRTS